MSTATIKLWGTTVGYIAMDEGETFARFEYDPDFVSRKIELAPLAMPVRANHIYQFADLPLHSFHGMPGLIADSLPDKYGQQLINVWLAQTGRKASDFNAVDRLCYTGKRGMGALEFEPSMPIDGGNDKRLDVQELTKLASMAFASKETLDTQFDQSGTDKALLDILSVGTSAGGARAKDPAGYGLLEYSYYLTARQCDIDMMECKLFSENGRNHFMTRRFDRDNDGSKRFVQTFGAMAHYDYYQSGLYSYEQLFMAMKQLHISKTSIEQQFRRTVFNLVGCNQDDHVKNFGFMMGRDGSWDITPAYDLCHSEGSDFTRFHQLSLNGKTTDFTLDDIKHLAQYAGLPRNREKRILEQTVEAFSQWHATATELAIPDKIQQHVLQTLRLNWT